jgi:probable biosynthetic protein (TIGR04098 family)
MKQYLHLIQKDFPSISEEDLKIPIIQTNIDSLDLIVIRVSLEKYFGIVVSDTIWYQYQTLSEALEYFHRNKKENPISNNLELKRIDHSENIEIRMPQMANSALSENWLLKYLGDYHWQLLSKGFGLKSSEFKDENGNRLYATFVRITCNNSPVDFFLENDILEFEGEIEAFGNNTFISKIKGNNQKGEISSKLMTTFSLRQTDNSTIEKSIPKEKQVNIKQIASIPQFINEYRLLKKSLLGTLETEYYNFKITDNSVFEVDYAINPYYEINGVGLLYFAAYPIIADTCLMKDPKFLENISSEFRENMHIDLYNTVFRDVFYFANCNSNDKIKVALNSIETDFDRIYFTTTLFRMSDKKIIAKIFTIKEHTSYT